jgi:hypothetical protein
MDAVVAKAVPVDFSYFYQGDTSVATQTGAIVDARSNREGVTATLDPRGDAALLPILSQYSTVPSAHALLSAVRAVAAAGPKRSYR